MSHNPRFPEYPAITSDTWYVDAFLAGPPIYVNDDGLFSQGRLTLMVCANGEHGPIVHAAFVNGCQSLYDFIKEAVALARNQAPSTIVMDHGLARHAGPLVVGGLLSISLASEPSPLERRGCRLISRFQDEVVEQLDRTPNRDRLNAALSDFLKANPDL